MRLADKVALVTAAGGPMGSAVARRFATEGAKLSINDISGNRLAGAERGIREAGGDVAALRGDVCEWNEAKALYDLAIERYGRVDVLVNIVGGMKGALEVPLAELDPERWDQTMRLNMHGTLAMTRLAAEGMRVQGGGSIVNVSSVVYAGGPTQADYAAGKAAVATFTRSTALALAPEIRVNAIMPGLIRTSVLERQAPGQLEAWIAATPLGKLGRPEDVANAALFLASDEAGHITGQFLYVSGGQWPSL